MRCSVIERTKAIASMSPSSSSPDPVATLQDALRQARQSLSFTSVWGWQETGTHDLHIRSYSTVSTVCKHGEGVESKPFRASGHRWKLTYYPNGKGYPASKTSSPGVELTLMDTRSVGGRVDATAGYTVSVLDRHGNLLCSRCVQPRHHSLWHCATKIDLRLKDATAEETKAALRRLKDDSLVVRCDITVHRSEKESRLRWLLRRFLD